MRKAPVVFLAFAPNGNPRTRIMSRLSQEARLLRAVLTPAHEQGRIRLEVCEAASLDDILRVLERNRNQVAVLHFAGPMDEESALLEKLVGTGGKPSPLQGQAGLKLIFLNACSTLAQANALHAAGVPAIITATSAAPEDACPVFALRFYRALTAGDTIAAAFAKAHAASTWEEDAQYGAFAPGLWQLSAPDPAAAAWQLPADALAFANAGVTLSKLTPWRTDADRATSERREIIRRVRAIWIDGVLAQSPQPRAPLTLVQRLPDGSEQPLAANADLAPLLAPLLAAEQKSLVILGAPGAGKSTLLLELTRALLDRCAVDKFAPVPVVLHLATWQPKLQTMDAWVSDQLWRVYHMPPTVAAGWFAANALALMLDGLDEMAADRRHDAVAAMNQLLAWRWHAPLALCCGEQEYAALAHPVEAGAVLRLLPLTDAQVGEHLQQYGGEAATRIEGLLTQDAGLHQVASSPLLLDMMLAAADELQPGPAQAASQPAEAQVFDAYLRARLRGCPANTERRLRWLAAKLTQLGQPNLLLEHMDKGWLNTPRQWLNWMAASGLLFGLGLGMFTLLIHAWWENGWWSGLPPVGVLLNVLETQTWGKVALGALCGLIFGAAAYNRQADTHFELSFGKAARLLGGWLLIAIVVFFLAGMILEVFDPYRQWDYFLPVMLTLTITAGLIPWRSLGAPLFSTALEVDFPVHSPTAGLVRLLLGSLVPGLLVALGITGFALLVAGVLGMGWRGWLVETALFFSLFVSLGTVPAAVLYSGAAPFIVYWLVRCTLWCDGSIPWRFVRFLDDCAARRLLCRVGPGYMFIHPSLQRYLNSKEVRQDYRIAGLLEYRSHLCI